MVYAKLKNGKKKVVLLGWEHFSDGHLFVKILQYKRSWVRSTLACVREFYKKKKIIKKRAKEKRKLYY